MHSRPLLLVESDSVSFYPAGAAANKALLESIREKTYVVTMDERLGVLQGQKLVIGGSPSSPSFSLVSQWTLNLGDTDVVSIVSKSTDERVHSQGRVMADR